jgi:selenocysteine lyase/cysteine desulfurase
MSIRVALACTKNRRTVPLARFCSPHLSCRQDFPSRRSLLFWHRTFSSKGAAAGYQSIGSFHSDNLADLLSQDETTYRAPPLPFETTPTTEEEDVRQDFSLDLDHWTFLNHGAFGASLRLGQQRASAWRDYLEEQPLRYHDRALLPHLAHSARLLATLLVGKLPSSSSYALLPNVTSGINAVLSNYSQRYGKEGHIIFWDTTYGSVKSMARHYGEKGQITEVPLVSDYLTSSLITVPSDESAMSVLSRALAKHTDRFVCTPTGPPPLLLLDHTTSNTALTFPLVELARFAREHLHPNTLVVVDGAHGLWAQDTVQVLGSSPSGDKDEGDQQGAINVYLANGHKWLAAPRGVALAWARDDELSQGLLAQPAVLSHGMHEVDLFSRFVWDGCRDYNAALATPAVLNYWNRETEAGETNLQRSRLKVREMLWKGLARLAQVWHGIPPDVVLLQEEGSQKGLLLAPYKEWLDAPMTLLRLPRKWESPAQSTSTDAKRVQDYLYEHGVEAPIKCIEGKLYIRISCHIYNQLEDFERLATVLG